jgi:signal transduction histidine kinase
MAYHKLPKEKGAKGEAETVRITGRGMMSDFSQKKRFIIMLIIIYILSIPVFSAFTYLILKENAVRDAYNLGRLRLTTMGAIKHYVAEELRPIFYREMPGRFIVEGMSRSFVAADIALRVQRDFPGYTYKHASLNPKNPLNTADSFEQGIITDFMKDRNRREWQGFRTLPDGEYYAIAQAGEVFSADCLLCHGDPAAAPRELTQRYGSTAGFNFKTGELADAAFVYIPISLPLAAARKLVAVLIVMYSLFGLLILSIVSIRFTKLYNTIEIDRKRIEEINLELMNLNHDMESIISERTMNLIALSVADRVRNPATAIAGTFNRILKKEAISEPLKERMTDLLMEAQKLDAIVKDYETILKSRQIMFKVENLNEIVQSVLPLVEKERREKNIEISLKLSDSPLRFVANRQLLRIALLHVLKNALEATPQGGIITILTTTDEDHLFLSVIDSGKGIPEEDIPKIFSLFYSTKKHRVGMGLPLVKQIIEEHQSEITVKSDLGKGTTFTLTFPVRWSEHSP